MTAGEGGSTATSQPMPALLQPSVSLTWMADTLAIINVSYFFTVFCFPARNGSDTGILMWPNYLNEL